MSGGESECWQVGILMKSLPSSVLGTKPICIGKHCKKSYKEAIKMANCNSCSKTDVL